MATDKLFQTADTAAGFEFRPGDEPVLVTDEAGFVAKVPRRQLGRAQAEGYAALTADETTRRAKLAEAAERQAGIVPALIAGTEEALSTATFGATDLAFQAAARLAGVSREEYLAGREERMAGSPIAAGVGTTLGILAPAIATAGIGGAAAGAARAAPVALAMRAGQAVTGAAEAGLGKVLAKTVGGVAEGALWGAGEGVRESILGKADNLGEAMLAHVTTDAALFGALGGGLGVLEAGLPVAYRGAKKALDAAYERTPIFGRRSLIEAAAKAPEETGIAAETARKLYAEREAVTQLDAQIKGAIDQLATATPEKIDQVLANVGRIEELGPSKQTLAAVLAAPKAQAEVVLGAVPAVQRLEAVSEKALADILAAPVEQATAVVANAEQIAALEAKAPGSLRQMLAADDAARVQLLAGAGESMGRLEQVAKGNLRELLTTASIEEAEFFARNADAIVELQTGIKGAVDVLRESSLEQAEWMVARRAELMAMEQQLPGSLPTFRSFLTGPNAEWSVREADDLLNNYRLVASMRNTNERARVIKQLTEDKVAQVSAGEKLASQMYQIAKEDRSEMLQAIGRPGGPPSLEGIQQALADATSSARATADRVLGDALQYDATIGKEIAGIAQRMEYELVGMAPRAATETQRAQAAKVLSDPVEAYDRLSMLRTELGELVGTLKKNPGLLSSQKRTLTQAQKLYGEISQVFHSTDVWGEAAASRALLDDAFKEWKSVTGKGSPFAQQFMTKTIIDGKATYTMKPTKINTWFNQLGEARAEAQVFENQSRTDAWHSVSKALEKMVEATKQALPSVAKGTADIGEAELRSLLERAAASTADAEKRGAYARIYNQMELNTKSGVQNTLGFRYGSANLGGYPHGVPTAGTTGAPNVGVMAPSAVPAAAGQTERMAEQLLREQRLTTRAREIAAGGRKVVEAGEEVAALEAIPPAIAGLGARVADIVPLGIGRTVAGVAGLVKDIPKFQWQVASRVRAMVALEKNARAVASRIEAGAAAAVKAAPVLKPVVAVPLAREERTEKLAVRRARERDKTVADMRRAVELASDVEEFTKHASDQSEAVAGDLPELTEAMTGRMRAAAQVLAEVVPPMPASQFDAWNPSDAEIARFRRVQRAVSDPATILDRVRDHTITAEEVSAAGRVFPSLLADMQVAVAGELNAAQASGKPLPRQRQQAIETLLGYQLSSDSSPAFVARTQQAFAAAHRGETNKADTLRPLPGAGKLTLGDRFNTPQQAAASRTA
jgi:hypothetical protein